MSDPPASQEKPPDGGQASKQRTMPPPELSERPAPASVGQLVLRASRVDAPLPRHRGARAEQAFLEGRLSDAAALGDREAERATCVALARLLASRGTDLDAATRHARRALALGEDGSLRAELAGWLSGLGEPELAAATLRGLVDPSRPKESAQTLIRIAVLLARADDAAGAADALEEAAALDPDEVIAYELQGTLAAWAPSEVPPEKAGEAYLLAAERRDAQKEREAAFEDRLRALEAAPGYAPAARAVAQTLIERGRIGAADEVMRAHAAVLPSAEARAIHVERLFRALAEGNHARAFGAALDAELEGDDSPEHATKIDELLTLAGLYELLAARMEIRAESHHGNARSEAYQALAQLYAGPLASPERALEAWIEAAAANPENTTAKGALIDHAELTSDTWPLCEALIRATLGSPTGRSDEALRRAAARELSSLAEDTLGDAALADWAAGELGALGAIDDAVAASKQRVEAGVRRYEEELAQAERALETAEDAAARVGAMRALAALRRSRPDQRARAIEAVAAVVRADPTDRAMALALDRLVRRPAGRDGGAAIPEQELYESVLRGRLDGTLPRGDQVKTRLTLAQLARRAGDPTRALEEAEALLAEAPGHRWAASVALLLAQQAGRPEARAEALEQLAGPVSVTLRAVLLAVAAELLHRAGAREDAARLAEQAAEADPSSARAIATLAVIAGDRGDRVGAAALERAMGVVVPRGPLCERLAASLESLSEMPLALAWTQRWLALRPGDARAARELIRRAAAARDASRLSDALSWVLAQPEPLGQLVEPFTRALRTLDELDRQRCSAIARRALDVFGPRVAELRGCLLEIADRSNNRALGIGVLERWIAADPDVGWEVLLDLSSRRRLAGDLDGAARELCRALDQGAPPDQTLLALQLLDAASADATPSSDGRLASGEVRARCLAALAPAPSDEVRRTPEERASALEAATAWRLLGSLRWDLADDWRGAEQAFFAASELDPEDGVRIYVRDLCEFAGTDDALEAVSERAGMMADESRRTRANLLLALAELAYRSGDHARALEASAQAVEIDATRAEAVALIEKTAAVEGGVDVLDHTYDRLADAAMGVYGRRAAHYRGARQLERRGHDERALRHAIAAFEAVPGEGTTFVLLARLAQRVGRAGEAIAAIERVADLGEPEERAVWLKRAADLADGSADSVQLRLDVLLRAFVLSPDAAIVADLDRAIGALPAGEGADEVLAMRLERAFRTVLPKLGGALGARIAIAIAAVSLSHIEGTDLALEALARAVVADGDIDDYASLVPLVTALAQHTDRAVRVVRQIEALANDPHRTASRALLELGAALASALGEPRSAASLLVHAARRDPDDEALVQAASQAVKALGDAKLEESFAEIAPMPRGVEEILAVAEGLVQAGDPGGAAEALTSALDDLSTEGDRERVAVALCDVREAEGRVDDAIEVMRKELARQPGPSERRLFWARRIAALFSSRGRHQEALQAMVAVTQRSTKHPAELRELLGLARAAGDASAQIELLSRLGDAAESEQERIEMLKELSTLSRELGDLGAAERHLQAVARLDPGDSETLEELERDAQSRGDHDAVAGILGRRVQKTTGDQRRLLRLRRAAVLEQRLGRLDDASKELEQLIEESPDDRSALPFLADLYERQGVSLLAAPLWARMSEIATDDEERADYAMRAARAYLQGGEVDAARGAMSTATAAGDTERRLALWVEIARRSPDSTALSNALAELADASRQPDAARAKLYLEAARAASAAGNTALAVARARRAKELAPTSPEAVLEARRLQYLIGGTGTPREAQEAVDELFEIEDALGPEHVELHAFLLAEELDVIQGGGAGMRELSRRHAELGPAPLIALGMAERLVRSKSYDAALPLFERALGGDLRGMRPRGRVALAAAEAAQNALELDTAARLLEEAAAEPETAKAAQRRQLELTAMRGDPDAARSALEQLVPESSGVNRARILGQLARMVSREDHAEAEQLYEQALSFSKGDRALRERLTDELDELRIGRAAQASEPPVRDSSPVSRPSSSGAPPPLRLRGGVRSSPRPPLQTSPLAVSHPPDDDDEVTEEEPVEAGEDTLAEEAAPDRAVAAAPVARSQPHPLSTTLPSEGADLSPVDEPSVSVPVESAPPLSPVPPTAPLGSPPPPPSPPAPPRSPLPPPMSRPAAQSPHEADLFAALVSGSSEAGEELLSIYAGAADEHRHDILTVLRHMVTLRPGDRRLLEALRAAAQADRHPVYARAVDHVLRAFDPGSGPLPPPPLENQQLAPELVVSLLFRDLAEDVNQALAIAWETGLFRRDPTHYALTGVERVQPGGATLLGEVYSIVMRVLGMTTPLFYRRDPSDPIASVALLSPPSVVLTGEVTSETPELRYRLGAAFAASMPENALVMGADAVKVRVLIDAMLAAFGPVERAPQSFTPGTHGPMSVRTASEVARIGGDLWQLVPPPAQRRMQAICSDPGRVTYERALSASRRAMRRAGLFAAGDVATAIREVMRELSLELSEPLEAPDGLRRACEEHEVIADLVRLATRSEYAGARWETASTSSIRRPSGSQRGRAKSPGGAG